MPVTIQPTSLKYKNSNNEFQTITAIKGDSGVYYGETEPSDPNVNVWIDPNGEAETFVQDVQVNGTSVVTDGVANVPIANSTTLGVSMPSNNGVQINAQGKLITKKASSAEVKTGSHDYNVITPKNQHESTFYGLAKLAGADMASSSNPVGTYTDAAKVAIQKMLGIYEAPWELIREDTFTNDTEADHIITVDGNGDSFELTDVIMMFETPRQATDSSKGNGGQIWYYYGDSSASYYAPEPGGWTQVAESSPHGMYNIIEQKNNMIFIGGTSNATSTNSGNLKYRYNAGFNEYASAGIFMAPAQRLIKKINIKSVLGTGHYKLYGKRKWQ